MLLNNENNACMHACISQPGASDQAAAVWVRKAEHGWWA